MNNPLAIVPLLLKTKRPSRTPDMRAVTCKFWVRKGYDALTLFGTIITRSQETADLFNQRHDALKHHEMIHLKQAMACHDSWLCFYILYIWYYLRALPYNRKMRNAAYWLNPFEMEAYAHDRDLGYADRHAAGANEWRQFARMTMAERRRKMAEVLRTA